MRSNPPWDRFPTSGAAKPGRPLLYQRYQNAKSGRRIQISDADLHKYTSKPETALREWAQDRPGVGGNTGMPATSRQGRRPGLVGWLLRRGGGVGAGARMRGKGI